MPLIYDDEAPMEDEEETCLVCGDGGNEECLVLCDGENCSAAVHPTPPTPLLTPPTQVL